MDHYNDTNQGVIFNLGTMDQGRIKALVGPFFFVGPRHFA